MIPKQKREDDYMTQTAQTSAPKLVTMDGNTLMNTEFEPLRFTSEKILPHGLFILAGSPKIGKSWLALDLCRAVATGTKLWDFPAAEGDVLYFALEDRYSRIQDRLKRISEEHTNLSRFHTAISSAGLNDGLLGQIHDFMALYPQTNLIIIDTFEHIRNSANGERTLYSCDYRDMNLLREITDKYNLTLLLVHHTRKQSDADPLNMVSGSTGLTGATDGLLVLEKKRRAENDARLTIANRDTEGFCFDLKFNTDTCRWDFIGNHIEESDDNSDDMLALLVDDFVEDKWSGTATELCNGLKSLDSSYDVFPSTVSKRLKTISNILGVEFNIIADFDSRSSNKRCISLERIPEEKSPDNDAMTG
jgi:hypothetical protein